MPGLLCGFAGGFAPGPLQPVCRKATLSSGDCFFLMPPFLWSRDCSVSAPQGAKGSSAAAGRSRSMPLSVESTEKRVCSQHSQSEMMSWISKLSRSWLRQLGSQLCDSGRMNSTNSFPAGRRELEEGNTTKSLLIPSPTLAPIFPCKPEGQYLRQQVQEESVFQSHFMWHHEESSVSLKSGTLGASCCSMSHRGLSPCPSPSPLFPPNPLDLTPTLHKKEGWCSQHKFLQVWPLGEGYETQPKNQG